MGSPVWARNRQASSLKTTNDSFRTDGTYIKVKGQWKYLYGAVDSSGNTIDFMLSENRDAPAAKRFFKKALTPPHNPSPRSQSIKPSLFYRNSTVKGREGSGS
jgi:IS6 family transposase